MEDGNKENSGGCLTKVILGVLFVSIAWGVPSCLRGKGFLHGIGENFEALIILVVIGAIIYLAIKFGMRN